MTTVWRPLDLNAACLQETAPLTQCSSSGYLFLTLITQLFGSVSYSISYTGSVPYPDEAPYPLSTPSPVYLPVFPTAVIPSNSPVYIPGQSPCYIRGQSPSYIPENLPTYIPSECIDSIPGYIPGTVQYSEFYSPMHYFGPDIQIDFLSLSQSENVEMLKMAAAMGDSNANTQTKGKQKLQSDIEFYDFIIVGGGSAGCVLANRLSEIKQWRILLLEAGPEEPDITMVPAFPQVLFGSSIDWNYRTQPEKLTCRGYRGQTCAWPRAKTMGGCSAINFMVYIRGNKLDYDGWANLGNPGWSYDEVLPYFKKLENNRNEEASDTVYHGVGGPLNVERYPYTDPNTPMLVEALIEKGLPQIDLTGPNNLGTNIAQSTSSGGRRFSTNLAYIRPIRNVRPNLKIIVNAYVTKIIIDPNCKTAQGVIYYKNSQYFFVKSRKEVIVSGGSINSPKLLMLSGVGPRQHLESFNIPVLADLKVGENFQDHVTTAGLIISLTKTSTYLNITEMLNEILQFRSQNQNNGPLSAGGSSSGTGFIKTRYAEVNAPDIQFHFFSTNVEDFYADPQTYMESNIVPLSSGNGLVAHPVLLTPKSRGHILLNQTNPVFGQPRIYPGFFTSHDDVKVLLEGMRFVESLGKTKAFKRDGATLIKTSIVGCDAHLWGSDEYFECLLYQYTSTLYHPVGTCKMGPASDKTAVVDARLRVHGIKYLRVIDASMMPNIVRGNTNVPIVMIAEKASDIIKQDWGH